MAGTVTSQLTNITLAESGDSGNWDDIGSGPGSGQSGDAPMQGAEARGRRADNGVKGFSYDTTTGVDISGTGIHVGFWVLVMQPALINSNGIELIIGDATNPKSGNWEGHFYDETSYPAPGGWVRVWVDPTRTADTSGGTLALTSIRQYGCEFDMGNVGGNALNVQLDRIDYASAGLLVDAGTVPSPAEFADFVAADEANSSNRYGVVQTKDAVTFCNARLTIADATATIFTDSGFSLQFSAQELAASDFMGLTIDLQNASTVVTFSGGSIKSGGSTILGDLIITGTSGSFDPTGTAMARLRTVELTSACTFTRCKFTECGVILANSAGELLACEIEDSTAASALSWDLNVDLDSKIDGTSFSSSGTGHAIEMGTTSPLTVTLTDVAFTGYAGTDGSTGNEAIWVRRTSGTVTINVSGGDTPTIRTDGATVNVVNSVTVEVTVKDASTLAAISGAAVVFEASDGTGPLPYRESVTIARSGSTATVTHTAHGLSTGDKVSIRAADQSAYNGVFTITVTTANAYTYTVAGTPTTPATGTITSNGVVLEGISNGSGIVTTSYAFTADQPSTGKVRKSSASPFYKTSPLVGDVTAAGFSATVFLVGDE